MKTGFWVYVELDPALIEEVGPEDIRQVCEEIESNVEGVQRVRPAMDRVGELIDSEYPEEGWMLYNDPAVAQD